MPVNELAILAKGDQFVADLARHPEFVLAPNTLQLSESLFHSRMAIFSVITKAAAVQRCGRSIPPGTRSPPLREYTEGSASDPKSATIVRTGSGRRSISNGGTGGSSGSSCRGSGQEFAATLKLQARLVPTRFATAGEIHPLNPKLGYRFQDGRDE